MIQMMVASPASGSGKTVVTCALLRLLLQRGWNPCAYKCGPDYIDPMFHQSVLGVESYNLDVFLSNEETLRALFARTCQGHNAAVVEAAMGFYDGLGATSDIGSAWQIAEVLHLPVLLVLPARGTGLTLAAQIYGMKEFRGNSHIEGVFLNECSPALYRKLAPVLEKETGIPVLGCLPHIDVAKIESRHLGLQTAQELKDMGERLTILAKELEGNTDIERLCSLFDRKEPDDFPIVASPPKHSCRIAVAKDEAFCFCYTETLELFHRLGAELCFFSPLHDSTLPENVGGLYLPGGYPELYAEQLAESASMRQSVAFAVREGLPTVAECGGFLYLGKTLISPEGIPFPMVGILPGTASNTGQLIHFGYAFLHSVQDSLLFRTGETIPIHEFHHWNSTENGTAFRLEKPMTGEMWYGGFTSKTLYAAFAHLYWEGFPAAAERFVAAAERFEEKRRYYVATRTIL